VIETPSPQQREIAHTRARRSPERERRAGLVSPVHLPRRSRSGLYPSARPIALALLGVFIASCSSTAPNPSSATQSTTSTRSTDSANDTPNALDTLLANRGADAPAPIGPGTARDVIVDESDWTYGGREGRLITTPSFRLHTTVDRSLLLDRMPRFIELALSSYRTSLGDLPEPPRTLETYVMRTRPQWESLTRSLTGRNAEIYLRIPRGGFALGGKGVYYDIGPQDTLAIAAHEGWHQYTQATFKNPLPIWLEEGIAAYSEGFRWHPADRTLPVFLPWSNPERFDMLRTAVAEDRLTPLHELLLDRPQDLLRTVNDDALVYYAQVWALVHFLHEGAGAKYRDGLARLLLDAAEGRLFPRLEARVGRRAARATLGRRVGDALFKIYFNDDLAEADAEYRRFVQAATLPGARQHMTQGRSPFGE